MENNVACPAARLPLRVPAIFITVSTARLLTPQDRRHNSQLVLPAREDERTKNKQQVAPGMWYRAGVWNTRSVSD